VRIDEALEQPLDREAENGVHGVRLDLAERLENEAALVHAGMRNLAPGQGDLGVAQEQQVDVDDARTSGDGPLSAHRPFDPAADPEDLLGPQVRLA